MGNQKQLICYIGDEVLDTGGDSLGVVRGAHVGLDGAMLLTVEKAHVQSQVAAGDVAARRETQAEPSVATRPFVTNIGNIVETPDGRQGIVVGLNLSHDLRRTAQVYMQQANADVVREFPEDGLRLIAQYAGADAMVRLLDSVVVKGEQTAELHVRLRGGETLAVAVGIANAGGDINIDSLTCDSVPMTQADSAAGDATDASTWFLLTDPGDHVVTIDLGIGSTGNIVAVAVALAGLTAPAAPEDLSVVGGGNSGTPATTTGPETLADDEVVLFAICANGPPTDLAAAVDGARALERRGTTGGNPTDNITLQVGYVVLTAKEALALSGTGMTSRLWAMVATSVALAPWVVGKA